VGAEVEAGAGANASGIGSDAGTPGSICACPAQLHEMLGSIMGGGGVEILLEDEGRFNGDADTDVGESPPPHA